MNAPPSSARARSPIGEVDRERLVVRHAPFVRRYLRVLGAAAGDDLDDLQQETFLALLSRPFDDRGDAPTRAFLRRTARNLFLRRHRGRMAQVEAADEVWDRRCGEAGDGSRYVDALRRCLDGLGDRARRLVDATYRDELGRAETARLLGLSVDGVKSALRRLRRALAECIERRNEG